MTEKTRFMSRKIICLASACLTTMAPAALAHPGHDAGAGFVAGAFHPLAGIDHLLALLAVGMLAARMRGLVGLALASMFLVILAVGIAGGLAGMSLPLSEVAIGASVIVTALLAIRPPRNLPVATTLLAVLFAFYHGTVHGLEAAGGDVRLQYAAGLVTASALVLALGGLAGGVLEARLARRPA